jgi:3-oxoacyl-[acyl-carrier-protein] synthase II
VPVDERKMGRAGQHVGTVPDEAIAHVAGLRGVSRTDRVCQLALAAADHALREAGLSLPLEHGGATERIPRERIALCLGTSGGPLASSFHAASAFAMGGEPMLRRSAPLAAVTSAHASPTGEVARRFAIKGPSFTVNAECASGNTVVALGQMLLASGTVDAVLCIGVDAAVIPFNLAQANTVGALAAGAGRPFSESRDGFVMAEGAGAVVIERLSAAEVDARPIHGVVESIGMTTDTSHPTAPNENGESIARAINEALTQAGYVASDIDVISAHGTGTASNDRVELVAIEEVLGARFPHVPIHSVKSMIGHSLAAAGLIELIVLTKSLERGIVPPTVNCDRPMNTTADIVTGEARSHAARVGLSISCGFGGNNTAALVTAAPRRGDGAEATAVTS